MDVGTRFFQNTIVTFLSSRCTLHENCFRFLSTTVAVRGVARRARRCIFFPLTLSRNFPISALIKHRRITSARPAREKLLALQVFVLAEIRTMLGRVSAECGVLSMREFKLNIAATTA